MCVHVCRGGGGGQGRNPQKPQQFADIQAPGDMVVPQKQALNLLDNRITWPTRF